MLVATNIAARGLDLTHVGLVINYELPETADALTHRIGRTARNGSAGRALTFVTSLDHEQWAKLRRQGAPALRSVDATAFANAGDWLYLDDSHHAIAATVPANSHRRARRRPFRGRPSPRS